jgi:hypothetical protein
MKRRENEGEKDHDITPFLEAKFPYFTYEASVFLPGCDIVVGGCRSGSSYGTLIIAVGAGDGAWA